LLRAVAGRAGSGGGADVVGAAAAEERGREPGKRPCHAVHAVLKQEGTVPPMPASAFVKEEVVPPMPPGAFVKEEVVVKQEAMVKREHEDVVDEGGPKRRRSA